MADPSTSLCAMGPLVAVPSCREAETGAERRTGRAKQCESSQGRGWMRKWACAPRGFCWQFFPEGMHCIRCRDRGREANSASQAKQAKQCESRCESSQGRGWLSPTRCYATSGLFWPSRPEETQSQQQATDKTKGVSQARRIPTHSPPFCPSISQTPTLPQLHRQCYRPLCIKMPEKM